MIDLNPAHLAIVERILAKHVPECEVRGFGSRATWNAKDHSDLDLAVVGEGPLPRRTLALLKEAFEESRLPMRVDVIDWNAITDGFRESIEPDTVVVQDAALPPGWRQALFGECAVLVRDTVSPIDMGDMPYVGLEHIGEGTLSLVELGVAAEVTSAKSRFKNNDVLFGKLRPYFRKVIRARFDGICSTDIWVIRPAEGVDAGYLFYVMASQAFVDAATRGSEGTRMPRAKWDFVSRIRLRLPPLEEQRAIAHVLGALDDKIELNRCMSETLEQMARTLFKSWFVDFDPVHAKAEGQPSGLPPDLDALFPGTFETSELGEIPKGWDVKKLEEISHLNPESWSRTNSPDDVEYVDLSNTKWGMIESTQHFIWKDAPSRARRILRSGDTIVGTVRPGNGSYSLIGNDGLTGSTGFAVLRPVHLRFRELVYLSVTAPNNIEWLAHRADGAAYPAVRPEIVSETKVAIPTVETDVLDWFSTVVGTMLNKIEFAKMESRTLAVLRDTLLPKLILGEIRVGHAERVLEAEI